MPMKRLPSSPKTHDSNFKEKFCAGPQFQRGACAASTAQTSYFSKCLPYIDIAISPSSIIRMGRFLFDAINDEQLYVVLACRWIARTLPGGNPWK
jgi:hypothetical protein